jgi:hypothetical protein
MPHHIVEAHNDGKVAVGKNYSNQFRPPTPHFNVKPPTKMPNPGLGFAKSAVRTHILYLFWLDSCPTNRTHGSEARACPCWARININGFCSAQQSKLHINYLHACHARLHVQLTTCIIKEVFLPVLNQQQTR